MTTKCSIPFIQNWTIALKDVPRYADFEGEFVEPLDYHIGLLIMESLNPLLTVEMKTEFNKAVLQKMNKSNGELVVKHNNTQFKLGRFYANENVSMIPHSKYIKHTIFRYLDWLDLDMIKGHSTIAVLMGESVGLNFNFLKHYTENFDTIAETLIEFYSVKTEGEEPLNKNDVKHFFNLMIYGGGFSTWKKDLAEDKPKKGKKAKKIQNENIMHEFAVSYKAQCEDIAKRIYSKNPSLVRKLKKEGDSAFDLKSRVVSYWFQTIENHVIYISYALLVEKGIIKEKRCGLEYDGLCIPPIGTEIDKVKLTADINSIIQLRTGLPIKMKFKDYDEKYVLTDIIEKRKSLIIAQPIETEMVVLESVESDSQAQARFLQLYPEFEKTHAKIVNKASFIKEKDDEVIIMSKNQIKTAYEHIECGFSNGIPVLFINRWTSFNDKIRKYDDMNIYPDASKCPKNIYNMWRPFAMELHKNPYTKNQEALDFILNHIKILCNHEIEVYDFLINWIAQMIQYPEIKSFVITLISLQGSGKGTLLKLLTLMLGKKKVLETTTPSRDVWGPFNGLMPNYFLINLNELSKKETVESEGQFKQMATDSTMTINQKGVAQYIIDSHHRFIITTNNEDPIKTTSDDRRNLIIRSSDEKKGNKEYFNKINEYMDDNDNVRTFYDYFKNIKEMDKFSSSQIPKTEYQNNLKEGARQTPDIWLEDFTRKNINLLSVERTPSSIYASFVDWRDSNGFDYNCNTQKLGIKLNTIAKGAITKGIHTRNGDTKIFNITKLKELYSIGNCLIDNPFDTQNEHSENNEPLLYNPDIHEIIEE
jgi:hypothetical protein